MGAVQRAIPVFLGLFAFFTPFSIAGAHISLALAVALLLAVPDARRRLAALRRHPLAWPVLFWCLLSVVAVVFAVDPAKSAPKLKKLALLPLIPLGALPIVRRSLRPILLVLLASTAIVSAWGLVTFFAEGGGLDARLRGIGGFYMTVAGILMIVGILCASQILAALKDVNARRMVFLSLCGALILAALAATMTRGSWIGFTVGMIYLLRKHRPVLLSVGVAAALFLLLGPADLRQGVRNLFDPHFQRNEERVLIWKHGLGLVDDDPLTGVGLVIPAELMQGEIETPHGVIRVHSHLHNVPLQIAVSMGLPALGVFAWLMVAMFRTGRRAERAMILNLWEQGLVSAFPAILLAMLVNGMFEWNFGDSEILGLLYCLAGLVVGVEAGPES